MWAGISVWGSTGVCIFEGILNAEGYVCILEDMLLPFLRNIYPDGHRFMQDIDPKHTSKRELTFFEENGVNWWRTPAENPDLNPIENLWHELKEFLRREIKPRTKEELVVGIRRFWGGVTAEKCTWYIRHLRRGLSREDGWL